MERQRQAGRLITIAYFGVMIGLCYLGYRFVIPALFPFLAAIFIARSLQKPLGFCKRHMRLRGRAAAAVAVSGFYAAVASLLYVIVSIIMRRGMALAVQLPDLYAATIRPGLSGMRHTLEGRLIQISPDLAGDLSALFDYAIAALGDLTMRLSASAAGWLGGFIGHIPELLLGAVFTIILTYLITPDYLHIVGFIMRQVPRELRSAVIDLKNFLLSTLWALTRAYALIMLITFLMLTVGLMLLGVPGAVKLALLIAAMDILPILGSGMIFVPWAGYCMLTDRPALGVGLLLIFALIETVRNFIEPHIIGDQIGLHPVATIVSSFIGLRLLGFGGIILAPILALTAKYLHEKGILRLYK